VISTSSLQKVFKFRVEFYIFTTAKGSDPNQGPDAMKYEPVDGFCQTPPLKAIF